MCSPSIIGVMTGMQGLFSVMQGNAANDAAKYNASILEQQGRDAVNQGNIAANEHRDKVRMLEGTQRAAAAANGIDLAGGGSFEDIQSQTAGMGELDALRIINNAQREQWGLNQQAQVQRAQGKNAQIGGYVNAFSNLMQGASSMGAFRNLAPTGGGTSNSPYTFGGKNWFTND